MTATGDELVTVAQVASALDISTVNSGVSGSEAVKLSQLKMLVDNMPSLDFQWTTVVLQGEQTGKFCDFEYATDFDADTTSMICVLHIGSGLPVVCLSSQLSPTLSNTIDTDTNTYYGDWNIRLKTNTGKIVVEISNNALNPQATISYAVF